VELVPIVVTLACAALLPAGGAAQMLQKSMSLEERYVACCLLLVFCFVPAVRGTDQWLQMPLLLIWQWHYQAVGTIHIWERQEIFLDCGKFSSVLKRIGKLGDLMVCRQRNQEPRLCSFGQTKVEWRSNKNKRRGNLFWVKAKRSYAEDRLHSLKLGHRWQARTRQHGEVHCSNSRSPGNGKTTAESGTLVCMEAKCHLGRGRVELLHF